MIDVDADVRRLINSAVDAELGPRCGGCQS